MIDCQELMSDIDERETCAGIIRGDSLGFIGSFLEKLQGAVAIRLKQQTGRQDLWIWVRSPVLASWTTSAASFFRIANLINSTST